MKSRPLAIKRFDVFDVADRACHVDRGLVVGAERTGPSLGEQRVRALVQIF